MTANGDLISQDIPEGMQRPNDPKAALLARLLDAFAGYFDIESESIDPPFAARATFHSRSEKYILVKSATIWAMEMNEYAYFAQTDALDEQTLQGWFEQALEQGMQQVKPHREHMYSYITLIIVADSIEPAAAKALKRLRRHKDFWLALHGWMEFRIAAIDLGKSSVITNYAGKDLRKVLEQQLRRQ